MPTITNPTPIEAATFSKLWVSRLTIFLPREGKERGSLDASLSPFDGENLLSTGTRQARATLPSASAQTNAMIAALVAEAKRLAGTGDEPKMVQVFAADPSKAVSAQFLFSGKTKPFRIPDCFALAATDQAFGQVFISSMAEIARIAGVGFVM